MQLTHVALQGFRSYKSISFSFNKKTTIVGRNTAGKSNLVEAITYLATGKSFRTDKDLQVISFANDFARVKGKIQEEDREVVLEVLITKQNATSSKKFLVNNVPRRRVDFATHLPLVLFSPEDLDIIIDGPSLRRNFLDSAIEQIDLEYSQALVQYTKALRQRNALLEKTRESGQRLTKQFAFWDEELIRYGDTITEKREAFISFLNTAEKRIFDCNVLYDKSVLSKERLKEYEREEVFAGVTLVGPHRDDVKIEMFHEESQSVKEVKHFGSRGQQRLVILQLKMLQIPYIQEKSGKTPLLVLDDIFSELDSKNITLVLSLINDSQVIVTTTHKEFVPEELLDGEGMIELGNYAGI